LFNGIIVFHRCGSRHIKYLFYLGVLAGKAIPNDVEIINIRKMTEIVIYRFIRACGLVYEKIDLNLF
jgi:hypothetical protein